MADHKKTLATLFAACWKDDALKARFIADPRTVLAEHGLDVPQGVEINVVENTADCVYVTIPPRPAGFEELSDAELANAAGGAEPNGTDLKS
ncbi:MAG: hypothetical protein RLZZ461_885 [Planctomycetota bacterium]